MVEKNQEVGEIESDKATLQLIAPESGKITFSINIGTTIPVGVVACVIDETIKVGKKETTKTEEKQAPKDETKLNTVHIVATVETNKETTKYKDVKVTPVARNIMDDKGLTVDDIINGLRKLGKDEVKSVIEGIDNKPKISQNPNVTRNENREQLSQLRKKLSKRLVAVKNETAMLTTFNEVDMTEVMAMRSKFQKQFSAGLT